MNPTWLELTVYGEVDPETCRVAGAGGSCCADDRPAMYHGGAGPGLSYRELLSAHSSVTS